MFGRQNAKLVNVREVDIHGAKFFDLSFALDAAPDQLKTSRIGQESVYANPQPGDAIMVHLVMGQATRVDKA